MLSRLSVSSNFVLVVINSLVCSWLLLDLEFLSVLVFVMVISNVSIMLFRCSVWHLHTYYCLNAFVSYSCWYTS